MKRIHLLALFTGLAIDLIGTIILSTALSFAFVAIRGASGQRPEAILHTLGKDPVFLVIGYALGSAFTLLGAYITARMSRPDSVINALLFGVISTLLIVFYAPMYPLWYSILCVLTIVPLSLVPGYLLSRKV